MSLEKENNDLKGQSQVYKTRHEYDHVWVEPNTGKSYDPDTHYDPVFDDPKNQG